jgi:hypothetical protein
MGDKGTIQFKIQNSKFKIQNSKFPDSRLPTPDYAVSMARKPRPPPASRLPTPDSLAPDHGEAVYNHARAQEHHVEDRVKE